MICALAPVRRTYFIGAIMRLFISINFDDISREKLYNHMKLLTNKCDSGSFIKKENIHLTLVFVGETNQIGAIVETMDAISTEPFELSLAEYGKFKRSGGDVYWIGIEKSPELVKLQKILYRSLVRRGVMSDKNDFKPHITVSRDTVIQKENVPEAFFDDKLSIKRISLMKCESSRDGMTFTELYAKELKNTISPPGFNE